MNWKNFYENAIAELRALNNPSAVEQHNRVQAGQPSFADAGAELHERMNEQLAWERADVPVGPQLAQQYGQGKTYDGVAVNDTFLQVRSDIPTLWRVTMGIEFVQFVDPPTHVDQGRSFARVTFGTGGASQMVLLDWGRGQSITVPGDFIQVAATLAPLGAATGQAPVNVFATAIPFCMSAPSSEPFKTEQITSPLLAGNQSSFVTIPPFAKEVQVFGRNVGSGTISMSLIFDGHAGEVARQQYNASNLRTQPNFSEWVPIPAGASGFSVLNTQGAGQIEDAKAVFKLQL